MKGLLFWVNGICHLSTTSLGLGIGGGDFWVGKKLVLKSDLGPRMVLLGKSYGLERIWFSAPESGGSCSQPLPALKLLESNRIGSESCPVFVGGLDTL